MSLRRLRLGELLALGGSICLLISLFITSYEGPPGNLTAWNTFGPAVILELLAICAGLALVVSALTERSPALPVSTAIWCVPLGLIATIATIVRVIERPDHATTVCLGAWLALAGALLILLGGWQAIRDERPSLYESAQPEARPRP